MPPFRAAIAADTTSIMPYYAYPSNESADQGLPRFSAAKQFEEVGFVLNKPFIKRKPTLTIGPDTGVNNVNRIMEIQKKIPTITAINMRSPWLINDIEPNAAAVIATFGVKTEALVDVIRGKFNPVGKLPFTLPANQKAVDNEIGDIPGFREAPSYVYRAKNGDAYGYNFGLSYHTTANARTTIMDKLEKFKEGMIDH